MARGGLIAVYPQQLHDFLLGAAEARGLAVDAATGLGFAALPLAHHFDRVLAVDKEPRVLRKALVRPRLHYLVAAAESLPLPSDCVDLLTVAQALHHLDLDRFYAEAKRVLRPRGVIACWCFGKHDLANHLDRHYRGIYRTLEPYWPPERRLVVEGYADLAFPFERIASPQITLSAHWRQEDFHTYLRSWTAFRRYVGEGNGDLLDEMQRHSWGESEERRQISWPIHLLIGRKPCW
jgi:ubiquinone/menaquinone biosynthesis C-methylase UbiE